MKANITVLSLGALLSFMLTGCGETFQGIYRGDATITGCGVFTEPHEMEVRTRINGNSTEVHITSLRSKSTGLENKLAQVFTRLPVSAAIRNDTYLEVVNAEMQQVDGQVAYVTVLGNMNTARDEINQFEYRVDNLTVGDGTAPCQATAKAAKLTLVK